ncbi:condensin complex subunit 2 [Nematocida parisii]|uniref:Condensin complex subunit 2 n=1 Tax=Nematocida parisii (strain ERTm3) TaxID=935791 RepID=I3EDB0_NEMP3|nr:uncharacterized protein NEPG_00619 [Nematocida parisii ERTm1]EIJ87207.1 hypothetical protein NEQG_02542 [Nematocida parisii ERTm3]KAI5126592.1 condensin complex subunit 2 [Nematocida parisii]EIJ95094.1 hypothetical protein NEPG_00619 [Nematocida parisii ERTm1]KAI5127875.1 condensin complex subunit 2 [Nematocida parisii]KAI5143186.1 condensin complex subunit 2 [Nematocida parisii]|eukprot:XP_013058450.1 hypothetical protein NEPG_00619 [Nematocida parisii ERTm1]
MAAGEREIADLLKESIESKINAKTTWHSTLIEEFSNIEKFKEKETNSMNFQHASIVLDGCVKVYSTRVDSVVDEADKLMDSVGRSKEPEKQKSRVRVHPTIEPNPEAILIKHRIASLDDEILEHLSREFKEGDTRGLLMHLLKWKDGEGFHVLRLPSKQDTVEAEKASETVEPHSMESTHSLNFSVHRQSLYQGENKKYISPMFATFTPDKSVEELVLPTYAYNISYDTDRLEYGYKESTAAFAGYSSYMDSAAADDFPDGASPSAENSGEAEASGQVVEQFRPSKEDLHLVYTPFGYAKGWAGPSHWKVHSRRKQKEKTDCRERKKAVIDFLTDTHLPISSLFEKGENIVMTPQQISERRKNCNTLPPDHNVGIEDLYKMFVFPGTLHATEKAHEVYEKGRTAHSTSPSMLDMPDTVYADQEDTNFVPPAHADMEHDVAENNAPLSYTQEDAGTAPTTLLSRRLLQSALRKARRNDIVKIKENMWDKIQQGEKKVNEMYNTIPEQKVSVQFYLVSLLHLANEKNLRITSTTTEPLPNISALSLDTPLV